MTSYSRTQEKLKILQLIRQHTNDNYTTNIINAERPESKFLSVVAMCAAEILNRLQMRCDKLKCEFVPWHFITGWRMLGNYRFGHGYLFSENACRDHAEAVGNCVHAHTHRAGMAKGRRLDNPTGYSVGTLAAIPNMDYAKARRSTLAWSAGFVWGEYTDDRAVIWLHEQPRTETAWKLPI